MTISKLSASLFVFALAGCVGAADSMDLARQVVPDQWEPVSLDSPIQHAFSEDARPNVFRVSAEDLSLSTASNAENSFGALIPYGAVWGPGSNLRVCFYNGSPQLRSFVASIAEEWNLVGADVTLDFGNMQSPRTCSSQQYSAIRIAFNEGGGNWSYIGREAITNAPRWDLPTMSLQPSEMGQAYVADAIVKHEFGHALGLIHEHQRPGSIGCGSEINLERAYTVFRPWPEEQTRRNLAPYEAPYPVETDILDTSSIMMYNLPAAVLYRGESSRCFTPYLNYQITDGDADVLIAAYSEEVQAYIREAIEQRAFLAHSAGNMASARQLAIAAQPYDVIESLAEDYEREGEFGFEPAPGTDVASRVENRIDEFFAGLGE